MKEYILPTLCYGCGTCSGICPNDAVVMRLDKKRGLCLPKIDETKCNGCGICTRVCPWQFLDKGELDTFVYDKQFHNILGNYLGCYLGYSTNVKLKRTSSSGGLVSALLRFALEEGIIDGALLTKMSETEPSTPESFIAKTENEIISAAGSKYIPVPANVALKEILKKKGKYAVVGLPCHIQGIRKAKKINEKLNERIIVHLGLICSGTISSYGTTLLLKSLNVNHKKISRIYYRGNGWPGGFRAILKNGTQTRAIPYSRYFSIIRFHLPLPCLVCWDSTNEFSDISFGDAGLDYIRNPDDKGTSLIISRTEVGEELLKAAESKGIIKLDRVPPQEVIRAQNGQINFKKKNLAMRLSLLKAITNEAPNFKNIEQLNEFSFVSKIRALSLFVRCLLMSNKITRNFLDPILMYSLKFRLKEYEHFTDRGN